MKRFNLFSRLFITLFAVTAISENVWADWVGTQSKQLSSSDYLKNGQWYVSYGTSEQTLEVHLVGSVWSRTLALQGPASKITFEAKKANASAGNLKVAQSSDGSNFGNPFYDQNPGTSYSKTNPYDLDKNTTTLKFYIETGATLTKYYKNVNVTMANYLYVTALDKASDSYDFGSAKINEADVSKTFRIYYCNGGAYKGGVTNATTLSITNSNTTNFSVDKTSVNINAGSFGYFDVTVTYNHKNAGEDQSATITIKDGGSYSVTITATGTTTKYDPAITWVIADQIANGEQIQESQVATTPSAGCTVTFSSSNEGVVKFEDGYLKAVGAGDVTLTAHVHGDDVFSDKDFTKTINVTNKTIQTIIWNQTLTSLKTTDGTVDLTATASSGLTCRYESSNTSVVSVLGSTLTIVGEGEAFVTAYQDGNGVYAAATPVEQAVLVFDPTQPCPSQITLQGSPTTIEDTGKEYSVGCPKKITFDERSSSIWTGKNLYVRQKVDGQWQQIYEQTDRSTDWKNNITITSANGLSIKATAIEIRTDATQGHDFRNLVYERETHTTPSTSSLSFAAYVGTNPKDQTFTVDNANSKIFVSCTNANFTVSPSSFGDCGLYINQTITVGYNAPSEVRTEPETGAIVFTNHMGQEVGRVSLSATVNKMDQQITSHNIGNSYKTTDKITLSAVVNSGLTDFTYTPSPSDVANVIGSVLTFNKSCDNLSITINQAGTSKYNPTSLVVNNITVSKVTPTIVTVPTASNVTYNNALSTSTLSGGKATVTLRGVANTEVEGTWTWKNPTQTITDAAGSHSYPVVFTPTNTAMYNSAESTVSVTVVRASNTLSIKDGSSDISTLTMENGGNKTLTISSNNPTTAYTVSPSSATNGITPSISGNNLTFTVATGSSNQSAIFTVNQAPSDYYVSASTQVTVQVKPIFFFEAKAEVGPTKQGEVSANVVASKTENFGTQSTSATATFSATSNDGYLFGGWYSTSDCSGSAVSTNNPYPITLTNSEADSKVSQTYYAKFYSNTYTVTLDNQGATTAGTASVQASSGAPMPAITVPTKTGYTFGGYYTGTGGFGTQYYKADGTSAKNWDLASNQTLYAKWTANTYTVTFNANGGSCATPSKSVTYDATYGDLPIPTYAGYAFAGWFTDATAGTQVTSTTKVQITTNQTLYAHWTGVTVSNAEAKTVNFTAQTQTQTADLIFNVANASSSSDFNEPTIIGDDWTIKSWNYANNQVTVTVSYTATENTTTRGNHESTVTLTAKSGASATGQVTAYVEMTPKYTNTLASSYTQGTAAIDLSTAWTSTSNGAITYSVQSVTPGIQINGTMLIFGDAGTATLTLNQAAGTSSKASSDTKTITVTKPANHLPITNAQSAWNNYQTAAQSMRWNNRIEFKEKELLDRKDVRYIEFTFVGVPQYLSFTANSDAPNQIPHWAWKQKINGSWVTIYEVDQKELSVSNYLLNPAATGLRFEYSVPEKVGYINTLSVTERSEVEASDMEFKRYYNEGPAEQTQKINWYNELPMTLSIEGTDADKFTLISPSSIASTHDAYATDVPVTIQYNEISSLGEHTANLVFTDAKGEVIKTVELKGYTQDAYYATAYAEARPNTSANIGQIFVTCNFTDPEILGWIASDQVDQSTNLKDNGASTTGSADITAIYYAKELPGYKFAGWYSNDACTNKVGDGDAADRNKYTETITTSSTTEPGPTIRRYAKFDGVTVSNATDQTVNFTTSGTKTATLTFAVTNADNNEDFNAPVVSGDAGWTMTSWTYANNNVTVTMSFTATEKTTTKGDHVATVTLTAKSGNSASGNVTAHVEMIPQYTCTIKDGYYVEAENNSLDLQTLWKSSSDGAITYEIVNFEAADGAQDGAIAPAISDNRYLSLGQAGTLELKLTQAAGTSSVAGEQTKTVTITRNPNPVTITVNGTALTNNPKSANIWLDDAQPCVISTANTRTQDNINVSQTAGSEYATYANGYLTTTYKLGTASFSVNQPQDYKYEAASDNFSATVAEGVYTCNGASLLANPTALTFSKIKGEDPVQKTFRLTYTSCSTIKVENSNPDAFEITPTSITITSRQANKTQDFTVTYKKFEEVRPSDNVTFTIYDHSHVITVTATGTTIDIQDPVFTCNIANNYNVDAAAINLANLWTSNNKYADAPITYSIDFTPDEGNHDGATGVNLSADNKLSFGDAGTVVITMHQDGNAFYRERTETKEVKINRNANTVKIEIQDQRTTKGERDLMTLFLGDAGYYWVTPTHTAMPVRVEQLDHFKSCTIYPDDGIVVAAATVTEEGEHVTFKVTQGETYKYTAIDTAFYATVSEYTDANCTCNSETSTTFNSDDAKIFDLSGENTGTLTYSVRATGTITGSPQYMGEYSEDGENWTTFQTWEKPGLTASSRTYTVPTNITKLRFTTQNLGSWVATIEIENISLPRAHYLKVGKTTADMKEDDIEMNDSKAPETIYLYEGTSVSHEFEVAWSACDWSNTVYLQCNRGGDAQFEPTNLPTIETTPTGAAHVKVTYTPTHWGLDTVIVAVYNRSHRRRVIFYVDVKPYTFNGDGDWNNAANWEDGKMPANFTTADVLVTAKATVNSDVAVKSIQLAAGSSLTLSHGTTLTVRQETNALHAQASYGDVTVQNGAKLNLQSGTFYAGNVTMQGGLYKNNEADAFGMPQLYIADAASLHTDAEQLNYEYSVDYTHYYPLALPFESSLAGLRYVSKPTASTASIIGEGNAIDICRYDGEERAEKNSSSQYSSSYWKSLSATDVLQPSTGYIITAKKLKGDTYATLRFPMAANNGYFTYGEQGSIDGETYRNAVEIGAWGVGEGTKTSWNNQGWNYVGNPYLSLKRGEDDEILLRVQDSIGDWWDYKPNLGNVRYVTMPNSSMNDYVQTPIIEAEINSFYPYFVQAKQDGFLLFDPSYRVAPNAPERRMMTAEDEGMQEQEVYITVKNDNMHDMIGLIVADNYTNNYEINADLVKMLGDANTLRSYLTVNNMDLAFAAVDPETAKEMIPVTVRIPEYGTYTWAVKGSSVTDQMDALYLTDFQEGKVVNLLEEDYTFTSSKAMLDDRFALNASFDKQDTPTDLQTNKNDKQMHKIIYKEHLYILRDGKVFDGQGKLIKRLLQ